MDGPGLAQHEPRAIVEEVHRALEGVAVRLVAKLRGTAGDPDHQRPPEDHRAAEDVRAALMVDRPRRPIKPARAPVERDDVRTHARIPRRAAMGALGAGDGRVDAPLRHRDRPRDAAAVGDPLEPHPLARVGVEGKDRALRGGGVQAATGDDRRARDIALPAVVGGRERPGGREQRNVGWGDHMLMALVARIRVVVTIGWPLAPRDDGPSATGCRRPGGMRPPNRQNRE